MTLYELNYTADRQAAIMKEIANDQLVKEYRAGQPTLTQRMAVTAGEALEAAGSWLKRRGSASNGYANMNQGLATPR